VHLVDQHWLLITRIAHALSVMGELDGATLTRVVSGESVWRLRENAPQSSLKAS
jgi:hypothetical protein